MEKLDWRMIEISLFCGEGRVVDSFSGVLKGKKPPFPISFYVQGLLFKRATSFAIQRRAQKSVSQITAVRAKFIQPTKLTHQENKKFRNKSFV